MESAASGGYLELIRSNRNFRNLWFGQIVSLFGDWFNLIASASLVASLSGSGIAVGGLFVARMLAPFLISPIAGVAADRYNRKHLLILTDVVRAFVVLGFLAVHSVELLWLVYALTFVQLAMHGVFFPTRNSILPDIVSETELGAANAITGATWSVMLAFGAAAGGFVAGGFGTDPAFIIDSLTFVVSIFFVSRIHYVPPRNDSHDKSLGAALDDYLEGLRYLARHRDILVIVLQKASLTLLVVGAFEVLQVAIARNVFSIGEGGGISLGFIYAVVGIGSGLGPILARSLTGDREYHLRLAILGSYVLMAIGLAVVATLHSFGVVLVGILVRAMGGGTLWVFSTQLLLHLVPENVRGRVFSSEYALLTLSMALSAGLAGWSLDETTLGIAGLVTWMSVGVLVPGALWAFWTIATRKSAR